MPDYYMADDGTLHDREAERRTRTQNSTPAAPAEHTDSVVNTAAPASFARRCAYWVFALIFAVTGAVYAYKFSCEEFTAPQHLNFIEDYVQQFVYDRAELLVIVLSVFAVYLYGTCLAPKQNFNCIAFLFTFALCCFAPCIAVFLLLSLPLLTALVLAALILIVLGIIGVIFS